MASRFWPRLLVGAWSLPRLITKPLHRKPAKPRRILIAHHLLLGDTIMLAPLLKKLRQEYPEADIVLLCPTPWLPLFANHPYGIRALPLDVRSVGNYCRLFAAGPFDWALVPGDNRWSWLASAMGARWITAFTDDTPSTKNWPIDELVEWPTEAASWGDIAAMLSPGKAPAPFCDGEWPAPPQVDISTFSRPYAVLHLGASSQHKLWSAEKWQTILAWSEVNGINPIISTGPNEHALAKEIDPAGRYTHLTGTLDLAGLWHLIANARFLMCPDTGVAHLGRLTGTPTVALFGPGSPVVSGAGKFWANSRFFPVWIEDMPCRDQNLLFERPLPWVRHCWRTPRECGNPSCMHRLSSDEPLRLLAQILS